MIDFDRQKHNILVTVLSDMGLPGWLLKIVMGFLTDRTLLVSYSGEKSTSKEMPGEGPKWTILGMFLILILILINSAGFADSKIYILERKSQSTSIEDIKCLINIGNMKMISLWQKLWN